MEVLGILCVKLDSFFIYDHLLLPVQNVSAIYVIRKKIKIFPSKVSFQCEYYHTLCVFTAHRLNYCQCSILNDFDCKLLLLSNAGKEHRRMWKVNN